MYRVSASWGPGPPPARIALKLHTKLQVLAISQQRSAHSQECKAFCWRRRLKSSSEQKLDMHRDMPDYSTTYLFKALGLRLQSSSCVVVQLPAAQPPGQHVDPPFILALFVTGDAEPALIPLAKSHPDLFEAVDAVHSSCPDRPGVTAVGV